MGCLRDNLIDVRFVWVLMRDCCFVGMEAVQVYVRNWYSTAAAAKVQAEMGPVCFFDLLISPGFPKTTPKPSTYAGTTQLESLHWNKTTRIPKRPDAGS